MRRIAISRIQHLSYNFNEDTCEVCLYDVENVVHSTENNENTCNVCTYDF